MSIFSMFLNMTVNSVLSQQITGALRLLKMDANCNNLVLYSYLIYVISRKCILDINTICFFLSKFVSKLFLKIMYYQYITSNLRVFVYTVSYMYFALYVYIITFVLFCQNLFIKLLLKITYYSYITPNLSVFVHTVPYMCSV